MWESDGRGFPKGGAGETQCGPPGGGGRGGEGGGKEWEVGVGAGQRREGGWAGGGPFGGGPRIPVGYETQKEGGVMNTMGWKIRRRRRSRDRPDAPVRSISDRK